MEEKVKAFLELATQKKASDIFIIAGRPLSVKIDGKLCTLDGFEERLMPPETDEFIRIIYKLAHDRNIEPMLETGDDDFSMAIPGLSRFRVNTYRQRGSLAAVIRIIAFNLPDPQDLHIPPAVMEAADLTKGMVLITGPAGSGKSTTNDQRDSLRNSHSGYFSLMGKRHSHPKTFRRRKCHAPFHRLR